MATWEMHKGRTADMATNTTAAWRRGVWVKGIALGVIAVSLLWIMRSLPLDPLRGLLQSTIRDAGVWGPVVFIGIYAVAVVCLVPGSLLTLAAGAAFGLVEGTLLVSFAATMGAAAAFLIARYLAREQVQKRVRQSPKLSAFDGAIGEQGWKIVALLRLSPAVPFTLQNYLYGVTAIQFWPCVLTSWVAMLPGTFLYVYLGSLGSKAIAGRSASTGEWILRGVGLLATILVTIYITRLAKRAMQEKIPVPTEDTDGPKNDPGETSAKGLVWWSLAAALAITLAVVAHLQKETLRQAIEQQTSNADQNASGRTMQNVPFNGKPQATASGNKDAVACGRVAGAQISLRNGRHGLNAGAMSFCLCTVDGPRICSKSSSSSNMRPSHPTQSPAACR